MTHDQKESGFANKGDAESLPRFPILDPYELGPLRDLRNELPPETQAALSHDDYVIEVITPDAAPLTARPSAIREIIRLSNAPTAQEIGHHGGPVASLASSEHADVEALRKFEVLHGRDALEIAMKLKDRYPLLLKSTILELAQTQGVHNETYQQDTPFRQEEYGRIILLNRDANDPVGKKFSQKLGWGWPFYGSVDATPSYMSAIAHYTADHDPAFLDVAYHARDGQEQTIAESLLRSTDWLLTKIEASPGGFVEFKNTAQKGGMDAQAWKDSAFAYAHADGERANHKDGIASIEVQALAYDALRDTADTLRSRMPALAYNLDVYASDLRDRVVKTFWVDDIEKGGYFALGADHDPDTGEYRPLQVRSSNMGHLLQSRFLEGEHPAIRTMRNQTIRQIFTPELLAHSGIRTLANDEHAYREGGYHTGSVWLWDTARTADGLERHGFDTLAWNLRERIWRACEETRSFPEFVRGNSDAQTRLNPSEIYVWNNKHHVLHLFEQPPQEIQGWTVSAILEAKYRYPQYLAKEQTHQPSLFEQEILNSIT